MANAQQLYQEALKQLAAGNDEEAIRLLGDALEQDDGFLPAWIKLAELMPDDDEKFDVLEQILALEPDNTFALAEWDRLNALAEGGSDVAAPTPATTTAASMADLFGPDDEFDDDDKPVRDTRDDGLGNFVPESDQTDNQQLRQKADDLFDRVNDQRKMLVSRLEKLEKAYIDPILGRYGATEEVVPGINRRDMGRTVVGLLVFTVFMCMCSNLIIGISNQQEAQVFAEQTRLVMEVTGIAETADANRTQAALDQTAVALSITETAQVLFTPVPTATNTPFVSLPTEIPPSATPTEVVITSRILPLPPASAAGRILAWGGNNPGSRQFLFLQTVDSATGAITQLNEDLVAFPTTDMLRSRIIYTQYDARNNESRLYRVDGAQPMMQGELMSLIWATGGVQNESRAVLAASGNYLVFIANTESPTTDVFVYDFLNSRLRQITRDTFNYRAAGIAPGGSQIVAVKEAAGGVDLVLIDVLINTEPENLPQTLLTTDGNLSVEDAPQFAPSGLYVVYHSANASSPNNNDIILYDLTTRTGTAIAASSADERYPYFSPDSRFILYSSNVTGTYNLFIYDTISQATFQLTESNLAPVFAAGWSTP